MIERLANSAIAALGANLPDEAGPSTLTVDAADGFPDGPQFRIRIGAELLRVTAGGSASTSWTAERGIEGTDVAAHAAGSSVVQVLTAGGLEELAEYLVPVGTILDFAGLAVPAGWLPCDGSAVARSAYPDLFATLVATYSRSLTNGSPNVGSFTQAEALRLVGARVQGTGIPASTYVASYSTSDSVNYTLVLTNNASSTTASTLNFSLWGAGDLSTTFNLPDFRRRVAVGAGGTGSADLSAFAGRTGGVESHPLTTAELAVHSHTVNPHSHTVGPHSHTVPPHAHTFAMAANGAAGAAYNIPWGGGANLQATSSVGLTTNTTSLTTNATSLTSNAAGSGNPHINLQPSAVVYKIVKF